MSVCVVLFEEVDGSQTNLSSYPGIASYSYDNEKIISIYSFSFSLIFIKSETFLPRIFVD